jgi:hypothetical protein
LLEFSSNSILYVFKSHEKNIGRLKAPYRNTSLGGGHTESRLTGGGREGGGGENGLSMPFFPGLVGVCVRTTPGRHRAHGGARAWYSPWKCFGAQIMAMSALEATMEPKRNEVGGWTGKIGA